MIYVDQNSIMSPDKPKESNGRIVTYKLTIEGEVQNYALDEDNDLLIIARELELSGNGKMNSKAKNTTIKVKNLTTSVSSSLSFSNNSTIIVEEIMILNGMFQQLGNNIETHIYCEKFF